MLAMHSKLSHYFPGVANDNAKYNSIICCTTKQLVCNCCKCDLLPLCYAGLKNPFTFMSYVTPVMAIVTAIISIAMDPWDDLRASRFFDSNAHIVRSSLLMLLGGALAFFMVCILYPFW